MTAIIAINLFCIFDTLDNCFAKLAEQQDVSFSNITCVRMSSNLLVACVLLLYYRKSAWADIPAGQTFSVMVRSLLQFGSQSLNVVMVSVLPLSTMNII